MKPKWSIWRIWRRDFNKRVEDRGVLDDRGGTASELVVVCSGKRPLFVDEKGQDGDFMMVGEESCDDEAVAAVVAWAADDQYFPRLGKRSLNVLGDRLSRVVHEVTCGNPEEVCVLVKDLDVAWR